MSTDQVAQGEFVEVRRPDTIVFTWGWAGSDDVPPGSTTVEIVLEVAGQGTLLRLRHTGLPDESAAALHTEGWEMYLGRLADAAGLTARDRSARHARGRP